MGRMTHNTHLLGLLLAGLVLVANIPATLAAQSSSAGEVETRISRWTGAVARMISRVFPIITPDLHPIPESTPSDYLSDLQAAGSILRWDAKRLPVRVYIANGEGLEGYQLGADETIWQSFKTWEERLPGTVRFVRVDAPAEADLEIYWTDRMLASEVAEFANATCERAVRNRREIFHAVITLCTKEPYTLAPFTQPRIRQLALHEIGHVLGLGHSRNEHDVMYGALGRVPILEPSERDMNTLRLIYQEVDVSTNSAEWVSQ